MSKKTPPKSQEGMMYKTWKNKTDMWKMPKEQQAIIVLLEALAGNAKAEKAVSELTATDINNENGLKIYKFS